MFKCIRSKYTHIDVLFQCFVFKVVTQQNYLQVGVHVFVDMWVHLCVSVLKTSFFFYVVMGFTFSNFIDVNFQVAARGDVIKVKILGTLALIDEGKECHFYLADDSTIATRGRYDDPTVPSHSAQFFFNIGDSTTMKIMN